MKVTWRSWFFALAATAGLGGATRAEDLSSVLADPFENVSSTAIFDGPPIKLVSQDCCEDQCAPSGHTGRDFVVCKDRCRGISAGMEVMYLRPYFSEDFLTTGAHLDYEPSYRYWAAYQSADGLGGRVRYWSIDQFEVLGATQVGVEYRTFDAEMTQSVDFRRWNLLLSGGLRYGEAANDINRNESGFDGIGLTFASQVTRDINRSGSLRMTMGARWSALFGNSKDFTNGVQTNIDRDDLINILEINIGPRYSRPFGNGTLTMGGGLEAQYWSNGATDDTQDFGFAGFGSSVSFTR